MARMSFRSQTKNTENQVLTFKQSRYIASNNRLKKWLIVSVGCNLMLLSYLFLTTI